MNDRVAVLYSMDASTYVEELLAHPLGLTRVGRHQTSRCDSSIAWNRGCAPRSSKSKARVAHEGEEVAVGSVQRAA
jgi:hypothetical protein